MSDTAISPSVNEDEALATPFVSCLVRLIRAKTPMVRGKAIGCRTAGRLHRHQRTAACLSSAIPSRTCCGGSTCLHCRRARDQGAFQPDDIANRGDENRKDFEPVLFTVGQLVVLSDVHRFGFETFRKLAEAGTKLVDDATAVIEAYPDVARA